MYQRNGFNQPYPNEEYQYYSGNMQYQTPHVYGPNNRGFGNQNREYGPPPGNYNPNYQGSYGIPYNYRYDDEYYDDDYYGYNDDYRYDDYYRGDGYYNYSHMGYGPYCGWMPNRPRWRNRGNIGPMGYSRPKGGFLRNLFNPGPSPYYNPMGSRGFWGNWWNPDTIPNLLNTPMVNNFFRGVGIAATGIFLAPTLARAIRPIVVQAVQGVMSITDELKTVVSDAKEDIEDMFAEANWDRINFDEKNQNQKQN
jgi:hypothetical protein